MGKMRSIKKFWKMRSNVPIGKNWEMGKLCSIKKFWKMRSNGPIGKKLKNGKNALGRKILKNAQQYAHLKKLKNGKNALDRKILKNALFFFLFLFDFFFVFYSFFFDFHIFNFFLRNQFILCLGYVFHRFQLTKRRWGAWGCNTEKQKLYIYLFFRLSRFYTRLDRLDFEIDQFFFSIFLDN